MLKNKKNNTILTVVLFALAAVVILFPLYITVVIALKTPEQIAQSVLAFPDKLHFENFITAIEKTNFFVTFKNTLIITVVSVAGTIATNSFMAFAITRNRGRKLYDFIYYFLISAMFIPFNIIMLPLVKQVSFFHMDNVPGLIVLYIVMGLPMNIFLYSGYIKSIPTALDEAATIDGANTFQMFYKVIFPVLKPMNATVAILTFLWCWNDFTMPLVIISDQKNQTLQLAQYVFKGSLQLITA
ncbi:MAG: carbohydrate ABC transporter permease [Blautia marasmi]